MGRCRTRSGCGPAHKDYQRRSCPATEETRTDQKSQLSEVENPQSFSAAPSSGGSLS
jgi:hypothetical protein